MCEINHYIYQCKHVHRYFICEFPPRRRCTTRQNVFHHLWEQFLVCPDCASGAYLLAWGQDHKVIDNPKMIFGDDGYLEEDGPHGIVEEDVIQEKNEAEEDDEIHETVPTWIPNPFFVTANDKEEIKSINACYSGLRICPTVGSSLKLSELLKDLEAHTNNSEI
ncbi:hypothetical protein K469DRAFT_68669 [Zopfia rhizophila CBS 207.26]|uniref:Uncharacterized protein n=1 Tax=Zopfia rhizophila CBS 207.26 TaxID=1314779 RepID=A0A6A6D7C9_9PEZI|nr:hypothetical protein K469DRAFT_68669 [Zopfia rhizophila CBS 207.26]